MRAEALRSALSAGLGGMNDVNRIAARSPDRRIRVAEQRDAATADSASQMRDAGVVADEDGAKLEKRRDPIQRLVANDDAAVRDLAVGGAEDADHLAAPPMPKTGQFRHSLPVLALATAAGVHDESLAVEAQGVGASARPAPRVVVDGEARRSWGDAGTAGELFGGVQPDAKVVEAEDIDRAFRDGPQVPAKVGITAAAPR